MNKEQTLNTLKKMHQEMQEWLTEGPTLRQKMLTSVGAKVLQHNLDTATAYRDALAVAISAVMKTP